MQQSITDLPGPKGLPLIGNILQVNPKKFHLHLEDWSDTYGPFYRFKLGPKKFVAVSDVSAIHDILKKRPDSFRRMRSIEEIFRELATEGVFSSEGEKWKRQRKLTMPAFHNNHLKQFFPTLVKITDRLKGRLSREARLGKDFEIGRDMMRYTVDVTSTLAFGYDMNTLENEGDVIQNYLEVLFPMFSRRINAAIPYWRYFKFPIDRKADRAKVELRKRVDELLATCRERVKQNPSVLEHPSTYIEALLAAKDADGSRLTDDELFGNILTILVAGEDTTAHSLSWAYDFMTQHPSVQKRMQDEADRVLGDSTQVTSFEQLDQFPYIEAVILESMRIKPVAAILLFEANHDVDVGSLHITAGTNIAAVASHGPLQEENYTFAKEFRPERWIDEERPAGWNHNLKAYLPFGSGPRVCPGRNLSIIEMKCVMTMFCRNFFVAKARDGRVPQDEFRFARVPADLWTWVGVRASIR